MFIPESFVHVLRHNVSHIHVYHDYLNSFRQGPIKLSEFADAVERFHKDSDLLFADAYKVG
jgi:hypothetical protein